MLSIQLLRLTREFKLIVKSVRRQTSVRELFFQHHNHSSPHKLYLQCVITTKTLRATDSEITLKSKHVQISDGGLKRKASSRKQESVIGLLTIYRHDVLVWTEPCRALKTGRDGSGAQGDERGRPSDGTIQHSRKLYGGFLLFA